MVVTGLGCSSCLGGAGWMSCPVIGVDLARHARLRRCPVCDTFWLEGERSVVPVSAEVAAREAPEAMPRG